MDEIPNLKKEIERLNKIITLLIEHNDLLRKEIDNLKSTNNYSNVKSDNGTNTNSSTNDNIENGTITNIYTNVDLTSGSTKDNSTIIEKEIGANMNKSTNVENENGINIIGNQASENENGTKPIFNEISKIYIPPFEVNSAAIINLGARLRNIFPLRTHRKKLRAVANQLLLLHNASHASSDELRKVSGLSKPGFAKHFPKLKRDGLIYKAGTRKYMLTNKSKEIIYKTFGGEIKKSNA
jgi:predicted transcriptional regulator